MSLLIVEELDISFSEEIQYLDWIIQHGHNSKNKNPSYLILAGVAARILVIFQDLSCKTTDMKTGVFMKFQQQVSSEFLEFLKHLGEDPVYFENRFHLRNEIIKNSV